VIRLDEGLRADPWGCSAGHCGSAKAPLRGASRARIAAGGGAGHIKGPEKRPIAI
jgi:hypothetical protein